MTEAVERYDAAERAFLASEDVTADARFVELEQIGARVRVLVSGEGPDMLFVPGVMTSGAVYASLVGRLPRFRCPFLPDAGVEMIGGAGHAPWLDEPDRVAAAVRHQLST